MTRCLTVAVNNRRVLSSDHEEIVGASGNRGIAAPGIFRLHVRFEARSSEHAVLWLYALHTSESQPWLLQEYDCRDAEDGACWAGFTARVDCRCRRVSTDARGGLEDSAARCSGVR